MHSSYQSTVTKVIQWAAQTPNVHAAIVIGSQIRTEYPGDQWSDLDLLLLVQDPPALIDCDEWLHQFGTPVCITQEVVALEHLQLVWYVKRPLYDDLQAIDFSILPFSRLEDVLQVNRDIHACGYSIIYSDSTEGLEEKFQKSIQGVAGPQLPRVTEAELYALVSDLLYHIIWTVRKVKRHELWSAVHCINCYMKQRLLTLMEMYNAVTSKNINRVMYDGRLLDSRMDPWVLEQLQGCFTKYDPTDVLTTLSNLYNLIFFLTSEIANRQHYPFDHALFKNIKEMYEKLNTEP